MFYRFLLDLRDQFKILNDAIKITVGFIKQWSVVLTTAGEK